ncbi:MAG TPA: aspartate aminotransferase family protein [Chitinophagaceae bacterium]|jgi:glutamate-1-semialdehyde 2,1-aminomutase
MLLEKNKNQFEEILSEGKKYIAGGVVSLNRKVDPPIIFESGKGSKIWDENGKEYIDYHAAFAPFLLGHNNDEINRKVINGIIQNKSLFGSSTNELEINLAKRLCNLIPSLELIQITNTGSEATAHAIRLARAYTGKDHIILMVGGYNGWHNDVARQVLPSLEEIGSRKSPGEYLFFPASAGIPASMIELIHCVNFNDLESVEYIMKKYPVACVLTEPVLQNVGVVLPKAGYLQGLFNLCEQYSTVCIFDEVKTGFRSALGGYQSIANVKPHLSVFGKAIANGYPIGVIGGKREIMELFDAKDAAKRVLIAGTYNAHPINTIAAIATIDILQNPEVYRQISYVSRLLYEGLESLFAEKGIPAVVARNESAYCVYFCDKAPLDAHDILIHHDFEFDLRLRRLLIDEGIYQIPIACKQNSISYAHSEEDIYKTLQKHKEALEQF